MGFRVSPGVTIREIDLTTVVPAVATTRGGFAGIFRWGPVGVVTLTTSEDDLVLKFGKPTNLNPQSFFSAAAFSNYTNALQVVRAANTTGSNTDIANTTLNAIANTSATTNNILLTSIVRNPEHYLSISAFNAAVHWVARFPGELGNSLKVSECDSANAFSSTFNLLPNANFDTVNTNISFTMNSNTAVAQFQHSNTGSNTDTLALANSFVNSLTVGDLIRSGNSIIGEQFMRIVTVGSPVSVNTSTHTVTLQFADRFSMGDDWESSTVNRFWEFYNSIRQAPGQTDFVREFGNTAANDAIHVVVSDQGGLISGIPGTVLEVYDSLSRASDARDESGQTLYYKDVVNTRSNYLWWANDRSGAVSNTAVNITSSSNDRPLTITMTGGQDGVNETAIPIGVLTAAWDGFRNTQTIDVSILIQGLSRGVQHGTQLANYLIALCEERKDCMVAISPEQADVVNASGLEVDNIVQFRNSLTSSSFAILDGNYKYIYDKYNDVYRWIPFNGDVAGLLARTETVRDAWWSPAGLNRGQIFNVVKLAWNPKEPQRDLLYKSDINPIISFPNQGVILFGDKTLYGKPSAFDRINVRRLFIVLEKAIATAANFTLFEFNDSFTRAQFRNAVEPFLRTIQGRRGITDFKVVCDETNNTPDVIDRNEFVGSIYIKANRSINFIRLDFINVGTGVEFNEIVGRTG